MYALECDINYKTELPIPDISHRFTNISNSNKQNIIIIKDQFRDPTFRYRGYNIIQTMRNNEKYNLNCFLVSELDVLYFII